METIIDLVHVISSTVMTFLNCHQTAGSFHVQLTVNYVNYVNFVCEVKWRMVIVYLTKKLEETDSFEFGRNITWYLESIMWKTKRK